MEEIVATSLRLECVCPKKVETFHSFSSPHPIQAIVQDAKPYYRVWVDGAALTGVWEGHIEVIAKDTPISQGFKSWVKQNFGDWPLPTEKSVVVTLKPLEGNFDLGEAAELKVHVSFSTCHGGFEEGYWQFGPEVPEFKPYLHKTFGLQVQLSDEMVNDSAWEMMAGHLAAAQAQIKEKLMMNLFDKPVSVSTPAPSSSVFAWGEDEDDWDESEDEDEVEDDEPTPVSTYRDIVPATITLGGPRQVTLED